MVEIGEKPILWHIMMHYWGYAFSEFVVALGCKGDYIKRWAADYARRSGDLTFHTADGRVEQQENSVYPDWSL